VHQRTHSPGVMLEALQVQQTSGIQTAALHANAGTHHLYHCDQRLSKLVFKKGRHCWLLNGAISLEPCQQRRFYLRSKKMHKRWTVPLSVHITRYREVV